MNQVTFDVAQFPNGEAIIANVRGYNTGSVSIPGELYGQYISGDYELVAENQVASKATADRLRTLSLNGACIRARRQGRGWSIA